MRLSSLIVIYTVPFLAASPLSPLSGDQKVLTGRRNVTKYHATVQNGGEDIQKPEFLTAESDFYFERRKLKEALLKEIISNVEIQDSASFNDNDSNDTDDGNATNYRNYSNDSNVQWDILKLHWDNDDKLVLKRHALVENTKKFILNITNGGLPKIMQGITLDLWGTLNAAKEESLLIIQLLLKFIIQSSIISVKYVVYLLEIARENVNLDETVRKYFGIVLNAFKLLYLLSEGNLVGENDRKSEVNPESSLGCTLVSNEESNESELLNMQEFAEFVNVLKTKNKCKKNINRKKHKTCYDSEEAESREIDDDEEEKKAKKLKGKAPRKEPYDRASRVKRLASELLGMNKESKEDNEDKEDDSQESSKSVLNVSSSKEEEGEEPTTSKQKEKHTSKKRNDSVSKNKFKELKKETNSNENEIDVSLDNLSNVEIIQPRNVGNKNSVRKPNKTSVAQTPITEKMLYNSPVGEIRVIQFSETNTPSAGTHKADKYSHHLEKGDEFPVTAAGVLTTSPPADRPKVTEFSEAPPLFVKEAKVNEFSEHPLNPVVDLELANSI